MTGQRSRNKGEGGLAVPNLPAVKRQGSQWIHSRESAQMTTCGAYVTKTIFKGFNAPTLHWEETNEEPNCPQCLKAGAERMEPGGRETHGTDTGKPECRGNGGPVQGGPAAGVGQREHKERHRNATPTASTPTKGRTRGNAGIRSATSGNAGADVVPDAAAEPAAVNTKHVWTTNATKTKRSSSGATSRKTGKGTKSKGKTTGKGSKSKTKPGEVGKES